MRLSVSTYNILSSSLSPPSHFPSYPPSVLNPSTRWDLISSRITQSCTAGSVICLQEVCCQYASKLHPLFASQNYAFIPSNYGTRFNNYMGVGVAYPMDRFNLDGNQSDIR